ncbi:MAG: electron transfer flavoprotein subunit beta/FixA family protein [Lentisphaeria bacterium]
MNILVLIKQVPESQAIRMDETTGTLIREASSSVINPLDLHALECALQLRNQSAENRLDCLSMGPPAAAAVLKEAVAMGADHGILLSDRAFAGSDTWCTARTLAAGIEQLGSYDLILCGERATDGETGQTGPALAALLDLPVVTFASSIQAVSGGWQIRRLLEDGYESVAVTGSVLVCVLKEASVPRLPTLQGKRKARQAEIRVINAEDLALPLEDTGLKASPTRVTTIFKPSHFKQCERISAQDPAGADFATERILALLQGKGVL